MSERLIDLNEARIPPTSEILSGRDCGEDFRRKFGLDAEDLKPSIVSVRIPDEIVSMNTSFFLGLFGPSVRLLTPEGFLKKYKFVCDEVHMSTIHEGMARAIKGQTIFPQKKTA